MPLMWLRIIAYLYLSATICNSSNGYEEISNVPVGDVLINAITQPSISAIVTCQYLCNEYAKEYIVKGELFECIRKCAETVTYARSNGEFNTAPSQVRVQNGVVYYKKNNSIGITFPPDSAQYSHISHRDGSLDIQSCNMTSNDISISLKKIISRHKQQASSLSIPIDKKSDIICPRRHLHMEHEYIATYTNVSSTLAHSKHKGAIVILAQAGAHTSYRSRDSLKELKYTLDLLYRNYNDVFHDDVWIVHDGDFTVDIQNDVRGRRREIRFYRLHGEDWSPVLPHVAAGFPQFTKEFRGKSYSLGYHLMIRFFAIRVWHVMARMGYTWIWRLDDDSALLSPISYNMFAFMETFNYQYAYRTAATESPGDLFWDLIQSHIVAEGIQDTKQLMDSCNLKQSYKDFNFANCGHMPSYYNNFFVTNITRWLQSDVQALLRKFDESGMIFLERWGDLSIQSAVVRLLFHEETLHRFSGWTYAHFSGEPSNPFHGIIQTGIFESNQTEAIVNFARSRNWSESLYGTSKYSFLLDSQTALFIHPSSSVMCDTKYTMCMC